jgi:hypothetical protein
MTADEKEEGKEKEKTKQGSPGVILTGIKSHNDRRPSTASTQPWGHLAGLGALHTCWRFCFVSDFFLAKFTLRGNTQSNKTERVVGG